MIGQFGHCNQDLVNLLLTGRATSNVMDGEVPLGDSGNIIIKNYYYFVNYNNNKQDSVSIIILRIITTTNKAS